MLPVHDGVGQGLELYAVHVAVQAGTRIARVRERDLPALVERACGGDAKERTLELQAAGERGVHSFVTLRR